MVTLLLTGTAISTWLVVILLNGLIPRWMERRVGDVERSANKNVLWRPASYTFGYWSLLYAIALVMWIGWPEDTLMKSTGGKVAFFISSVLNPLWLYLWLADHRGAAALDLLALCASTFCVVLFEWHNSLVLVNVFGSYATWTFGASLLNISVLFRNVPNTMAWSSVLLLLACGIAWYFTKQHGIGAIATLLWVTVGIFAQSPTEYWAITAVVGGVGLGVIFTSYMIHSML